MNLATMVHEVVNSHPSMLRFRKNMAAKRAIRSSNSSSGSSTGSSTSAGSPCSGGGSSPKDADGEIEEEDGPDDLDEEWEFIPKVSSRTQAPRAQAD